MKTENIWVAVNKDNSVSMFAEEPKRNKKAGIWFSKYPYCNCIAYKEISNFVLRAGMTWEHEPEPIPVEID